MPQSQQTQLTEQRQAFTAALAHFYPWIDPDEAAATFLDACAQSLVDAREPGDRLILPLKFAASVNQNAA